MHFISEDTNVDEDNFLELSKDKVYVIYVMRQTLNNILAVVTVPEKVLDLLYTEAPRTRIVVTIEDIKNLEPSDEALIATKNYDPEYRIAACGLDDIPNAFSCELC